MIVGPDSFGTIQLEIDHEYLLLYVYSLSLQAIVLSRTHNASKIIPRPPADRQILATADQEFVLLAVDAAKNVIRLVTQEITKFVSASYLSARYFCKVVFSASFLIKVLSRLTAHTDIRSCILVVSILPCTHLSSRFWTKQSSVFSLLPSTMFIPPSAMLTS